MSPPKALRSAALALAALALTACAGPTATNSSLSVADRLYLGGHGPNGPIPESEWERFVADVVTPLFPDGLTLWRAQGQWRGETGAITREPVLVIEILHAGDAVSEESLERIARAYRERFAQDAVLRARSRIAGSLVR